MKEEIMREAHFTHMTQQFVLSYSKTVLCLNDEGSDIWCRLSQLRHDFFSPQESLYIHGKVTLRLIS